MTPTQTTAAPDPVRVARAAYEAMFGEKPRKGTALEAMERTARAMQEAMSAQGGGEVFNPLDEVMQQELRGRAADMLKAHGWKAGDRLHLMGQIGNMVEFAIDVLRKPPARCDYPGCGCDHDAHCNVSLARPSPEVKDAPVSTSGFGLPSGWKPSPLLGKALDAYRKIKCDYQREDGDRRGIGHALLKAEFGIIEAIFHDHDEDAEVYQNAPVVELMVDLIDRLTNAPSPALSLARPAPEVKDAPARNLHEAYTREKAAAQYQAAVDKVNGTVRPTTPAPAASDELVERNLTGETWNGMPVFAWTWEVPSQLPGSETVPCFATHWSTGPADAERCFRQSVVQARIEADAAEMERKDARIAELEGDCRSYAKTMEAIEKADARDQALIRDLEASATAAEAERDAWRARESETQEALQKIGEEFGVRGGEPRVDGVRRVLSEMRAERDMLRVTLTMPDKDRRQWVLADLIATRGYFNRSDLIKMFGVSVPQASVDIRRFLAKHPHVATYNTSAKRYERAALRPEAKGGREDVG